jgi:hypothetical protein
LASLTVTAKKLGKLVSGRLRHLHKTSNAKNSKENNFEMKKKRSKANYTSKLNNRKRKRWDRVGIMIKVSYVFSCNRFYVQLKSKEDDLLRLMLDIQGLCRDSDGINNNKIKVGLPCYALFEADQQWYRSQIVEVQGGTKAKVQYVDYGNEEVVSTSALKPIEGKQLTILRPQAIECCLNGYQNMEPDLERDNLLEELILEQEFTMKVVEMQGKKALIELIDGANYNVASLLLDKIAVTRSQVSPMLVQAGNKIEHRKSVHQYNSRDQSDKQDCRKSDRLEF